MVSRSLGLISSRASAASARADGLVVDLGALAACRLDFVGWALKGFPFAVLLASDAADEFSWRLRQATPARRDRRCGRIHDGAGTSEGRPMETPARLQSSVPIWRGLRLQRYLQ
jgi:hypothetical protein